jgi:DNA-binding transcriptional regulator PaaX
VNKYHAQRCEWQGMTFDSRHEMRRYQELDVLQCGGAIRNLKRQVPYDLAVNGIKVCRYVADAVYEELWPALGGEWRVVVEDAKSPATRTPAYKLKRALMRACLGITIREVE